MNILLSAYSFRPHSGSEPGVAWNFAVELSKNNKVYVVTRARSKAEIEAELQIAGLYERIKVYYYDIPRINKLYKSATISEHLYYSLWQLVLPFIANNILEKNKIDIIHHITLGAFRIPSLLCFYKLPFIFGPVGGGESFPYRIKKDFSAKFIFQEVIRDLVNKLSLLNPFLLYTFYRSSLIVCRTKETLRLIPSWFRHKCMIEIGIGAQIIRETSPTSPLSAPDTPLKILYAGRPVYWKGLHLVIQAYAKALRQCPHLQFTVIGPGNIDWAKKIADKHHVGDKIRWLGRVDPHTMDNLYETSDMLMFPSLREAGGAVAVEALAYSLPVLCLDLGGPSQIVNNNWGIVLSTKNKDQAQLINDIANEMVCYYFDKTPLRKKKMNAENEARAYSMDKIVEKIYSHPLLHKTTVDKAIKA
jgi:glycosyltransferase involved in cell wall biosynthesis